MKTLRKALNNKINFVAVIVVDMANPNGDPMADNMPRTTLDGFGEITDVCIKRKIRNRMMDLGNEIFVKPDDRCDDGCDTLAKRAEKNGFKKIKDRDEFYEKACDLWTDVRTFGQVFSLPKAFGVKSLGVNGPVSVREILSVEPVEIVSTQITKSTSGDKEEGKERGSDTMGMKHYVRHGVYVIRGSISAYKAEKTGFTDEDAELLKECLRTLFVNDSSAARPEGSMEVYKLFWFKHSSKLGQYSTPKVHRSVKVSVKPEVDIPKSIDDYDIALAPLPGLEVEEIEGE